MSITYGRSLSSYFMSRPSYCMSTLCIYLLELSTTYTRSLTTKDIIVKGNLYKDKSLPTVEARNDICSPYYHKEDKELI